MARPRKVPERARVITAYDDLQSYVKSFVSGEDHQFLWLHARPGLGKTEAVTGAIRGMQALYVKGHVTPARFYAEAYRHRGRPIVLDDAEGLLRQDDGLEIANALGDTTRERVVCWGTSAARSLGEGV